MKCHRPIKVILSCQRVKDFNRLTAFRSRNPSELRRWTVQRIEVIAIATLLGCLSHGTLADDQPSPSPTPAYLHHPPPGRLRRVEEIDRRHALDARSESRAQTRAQAKADHHATATAEAEAKAAARARDRAQRQVDTEAHLEAAKATPHPTSDLMKRMGFSEQEIAAEKAKEESAKPEANPSQSPAKANAASPAPDSGSH